MKGLLHSGPWDQPGQTLPFLLFVCFTRLLRCQLSFSWFMDGSDRRRDILYKDVRGIVRRYKGPRDAFGGLRVC